MLEEKNDASIVVTSLGDDLNAGGGVTLREAILAAESDSSVDGSAAGSGADTITFAPALYANGPAKIDLTQGPSFSFLIGRSELKITTDISIVGPTGRNGLVVNSAASKRLFEVTPGGRLRLENLTLTGGKTIGPSGSGGGGGGAALGGAVFNRSEERRVGKECA